MQNKQSLLGLETHLVLLQWGDHSDETNELPTASDLALGLLERCVLLNMDSVKLHLQLSYHGCCRWHGTYFV